MIGGLVMENVIEFPLNLERQNGSLVGRKANAKAKTVRMSVVEWYQMLRAHHHWTVFEAIRFALWLAR